MSAKLPTYFISHGGGPWPWMEDRAREFAPLAVSFQEMSAELATPPKAILMVSGHWETETPQVMAHPNPPMEYDYSGFPPHTYEIQYSAPGAPELAARSQAMLQAAGIKADLNVTQGYDHGTFVPAFVMYPEANVPVYQISILHSYDPQKHFEMGRALAPLREEGVLIVGSGLSYHNLRNFGPQAKVPSETFDQWLTDTLALPKEERTQRLLEWESAPYARDCHAEEDHLVPLFVALGAAEDDVSARTYHQREIRGGVTASSYKFG